MAATKAPNPTDRHVGNRVRMRRKMLAMSQDKLGDALGVTFQQVQKYEKGANRIGASCLQQISHILQVPVAFFFEGAPTLHVSGYRAKGAPSPADISDFLATSEGLSLVRAFNCIKQLKLRRRIVGLVEEIAGLQHHRSLPQSSSASRLTAGAVSAPAARHCRGPSPLGNRA